MDIITGYLGEPHVTAEQDRDVNIGVVAMDHMSCRQDKDWRQRCRRIMK